MQLLSKLFQIGSSDQVFGAMAQCKTTVSKPEHYNFFSPSQYIICTVAKG